MSGRARLLAAAALVAATALIVAGCKHGETPTHVHEGGHLELGELSYLVKMTRFLNPFDVTDRDYLGPDLEQFEADLDPNLIYLGTFLEIENEGDQAQPLPEGVRLVDTREQVFEPLEFESVFALDLEDEVPAHGKVPNPDTPAAQGPIHGSLLLFAVPEEVTENRPLELVIPGPDGETGFIELDI